MAATDAERPEHRRRAEKRVWVTEAVKERLLSIGKKSESYNDIIDRVLNGEFDGLTEENIEQLRGILTAFDEPLNIQNVSHAALKAMGKLSAVLNYRGEEWLDHHPTRCEQRGEEKRASPEYPPTDFLLPPIPRQLEPPETGRFRAYFKSRRPQTPPVDKSFSKFYCPQQWVWAVSPPFTHLSSG